ncbi:hypothetical protein [Halomonas sp. NO4]|uniref:phage fiber-tail adaptor protein n=1 Tax=Halomonas sp. NO4 TaxID=2484813 RepID=UPI0013D32FBC|nr:hypothetical protein [Halomonas sp. NO4]
MKVFRKQPNDHLDYRVDLSEWLEDGDEVTSVEVTAPDGIELTGDSISTDKVELWIKGGESGKSYQFSPLIHTTTRTKEVDFLIVVAEI